MDKRTEFWDRVEGWQGNQADALIEPDGMVVRYSALKEAIDGLDNILQRLSGSRPAVVMCPVPTGVIGLAVFLGVARRNSFVPIGPTLPRAAIAKQARTVGASVYLTFSGEDAVWAAKELRCHSLYVKSLHETGSWECEEFAVDTGTPSARTDSVYPLMITTSGSTGDPKIVALSWTNLCTAMEAIVRNFALGPKDRVYSPMPLFHLHGLISAGATTLLSGGAFCAPAQRFDGAQAVKHVVQCAATWVTMLPIMHQKMLEASGGVPIRSAALRFVRSSSAPLQPELIAALEAFYGVPLFETYGLTETASLFTSPALDGPRKHGSVGRPICGELHIRASEDLEPDQKGSGEILLRGPSVITQYLGQGGEESFVDGWLRTGDIGYVDPDGDLFITGRAKDIVKRNGYKIFLAEIDRTLSEHPDVTAALTFAYPHPRMREDIVAAVTVRNETVTGEQLRAFLYEQLPDYKVPSDVVVLQDLPRSMQGKLHRGLLKDQILGAYRQTKYQRPLSPQEALLAEIWNAEMQTSHISVDSNLFVMGADNQMFRNVWSKLPDQGFPPSEQRLFLRCPTIREQLAFLYPTKVSQVP